MAAPGYNPLRWDCAAQGCFNLKRRPKIELFADCFPGRISFGDVDGIVEIGGNALLMEWKSEPRELPAGQRLLYQRLSRSGPVAVIVRTLVESGECLVRIRERRVEDGLPVPLQLQLLEPDHLDAGKTGDAPGGGFVIQGVEFDALGRRRAYWLYPVHPGEVAMFRRASLVSQPVPAASVLHLFDRLRPGQVRGVPWFAPVILKLRDLDEYDDAELVRKKIEACFAAFVTGSDDEETLGRATSDGRVLGSGVAAVGKWPDAATAMSQAAAGRLSTAVAIASLQ